MVFQNGDSINFTDHSSVKITKLIVCYLRISSNKIIFHSMVELSEKRSPSILRALYHPLLPRTEEPHNTAIIIKEIVLDFCVFRIWEKKKFVRATLSRHNTIAGDEPRVPTHANSLKSRSRILSRPKN